MHLNRTSSSIKKKKLRCIKNLYRHVFIKLTQSHSGIGHSAFTFFATMGNSTNQCFIQRAAEIKFIKLCQSIYQA